MLVLPLLLLLHCGDEPVMNPAILSLHGLSKTLCARTPHPRALVVAASAEHTANDGGLFLSIATFRTRPLVSLVLLAPTLYVLQWVELCASSLKYHTVVTSCLLLVFVS